MPRKKDLPYKTERDIFATRLRELMKERGTNQTKLSAQILEEQGQVMQRQTISQYMNGQSKPDTERLTLLCRALDISADYLLGLSEVQSFNVDIKAVCKYTGLSEKAVKAIVDLNEYADLCCENADKDDEDSELKANNAVGIFGMFDEFLSLDACYSLIEHLYALRIISANAKTLDIILNMRTNSTQGSVEKSLNELLELERDYKFLLFELSEIPKQAAEELYKIHELEAFLNEKTKYYNNILLTEHKAAKEEKKQS